MISKEKTLGPIPAHFKLRAKANNIWIYLDRVKRIWYLSPMRAAKVQASLRIHTVSPEPSLLAHTSSESRGTFRQKARSLAPLNGWACAVEICHNGMLEDTNSLDGAHLQCICLQFSRRLHVCTVFQTWCTKNVRENGTIFSQEYYPFSSSHWQLRSRHQLLKDRFKIVDCTANDNYFLTTHFTLYVPHDIMYTHFQQITDRDTPSSSSTRNKQCKWNCLRF